MKQVFEKFLSLLKRFFLSLRIHLHVGIHTEEDTAKSKDEAQGG